MDKPRNSSYTDTTTDHRLLKQPTQRYVKLQVRGFTAAFSSSPPVSRSSCRCPWTSSSACPLQAGLGAQPLCSPCVLPVLSVHPEQPAAALTTPNPPTQSRRCCTAPRGPKIPQRQGQPSPILSLPFRSSISAPCKRKDGFPNPCRTWLWVDQKAPKSLGLAPGVSALRAGNYPARGAGSDGRGLEGTAGQLRGEQPAAP